MAKQFVAAAGTATAATATTATTATTTTTAVVQRENIENLVSSCSKNGQNTTEQLFLFLRESMNVRTKITE